MKKTGWIRTLTVLLMMTVLGEAGLVRRKKRLPDTGPAKAKVQSHRQWVEYRTPLVRGAPPSAPHCPRANDRITWKKR